MGGDGGGFLESTASRDEDVFGGTSSGGFEPFDAAAADDPFGGELPSGDDPFDMPAGLAAVGRPARQFAAPARPAPVASEPTPAPAASPLTEGPRGLMIATAASAAVFLLLLFGVGGVAAYQNSPGGSRAGSVAEASVPDGFTLYDEHGVTIHLPIGQEIPVHGSAWETRAIQTASGTVYFVGVTPSTNVREGQKLQRRMDTFMSGGFLQAGIASRNGYEGIRGRLDQCIYLPNMNLEVYQLDGRFVVIGVSSGGSTDAAGNTVVGGSVEPENETTFYDSLTIGPQPSGGLW